MIATHESLTDEQKKITSSLINRGPQPRQHHFHIDKGLFLSPFVHQVRKVIYKKWFSWQHVCAIVYSVVISASPEYFYTTCRELLERKKDKIDAIRGMSAPNFGVRFFSRLCKNREDADPLLVEKHCHESTKRAVQCLIDMAEDYSTL